MNHQNEHCPSDDMKKFKLRILVMKLFQICSA